MESQPALVYDVGAVLVDWNPRYLYQELISDPNELEFFLTEVGSFEWHAQSDAGKSFGEMIAERKAEWPGRYEALLDAWWEEWDKMCGGLIPGMFELIDWVRDHYRETKVFAITNFSAETWPRLCELYPRFNTTFDDIVVSGRVGIVKPNPEIFNLAAKQFGVNPEQCLFIDDRADNIEAATRQGYKGHQYKSVAQLEPVLKAHLEQG